MTRGRWVAIIVAILALGAVCTSDTFYYWVAYEQHTDDRGVKYLWKRTSWIPGPEVVLPFVVCNWCARGHHSLCDDGIEAPYVPSLWGQAYPWGSKTDHPPFDGQFRCACSHGYHAEDADR